MQAYGIPWVKHCFTAPVHFLVFLNKKCQTLPQKKIAYEPSDTPNLKPHLSGQTFFFFFLAVYKL